MSLPISERGAAILLILALSGCGRAEQENGERQAEKDIPKHVACALSGATEFLQNCTIEYAQQGDGTYLLIRHPDGGFRKFMVLRDGRGLAAAHGADPTRINVIGDGQIELLSGDDKYHLSARIRDSSAAQ